MSEQNNKEEIKQELTTIEDQAASVMKLYWGPFSKGVNTLSSKGLVRVMKALVGYPWEQKDLRFKDKNELDVYLAAEQLRSANDIMRHVSYGKSQEENKTNENKGELENVTTTEQVG